MALEGNLALIGAGSMGEALLRGILHAQEMQANQMMATGPRLERLSGLEERYQINTTQDNVEAVKDADIIILAVKPQIMQEVLLGIAPHIKSNALVISVAAGVTIGTIEAVLGVEAHVCRAMPNTPAIVGAAATALAVGAHVSPEEVEVVTKIFTAIGSVSVVSESLLDAVTGLSGSGPAYVFMIIEALSDAGVKVGLPRYEAQKLAAQTVLGSAKLLIETGEHPGVLKDRVTSPGGTAIVGLHTLEEGGLRTTLINAVVAATERSHDLGKRLSHSDE
jgi:pyrroline-5-carboxylate reductase